VLLSLWVFYSSSGRRKPRRSSANVYPDGTVQFQPSAALTFSASSSAAIASTAVSVQLTGTSLPGQTFVTTLTIANGLVFGGAPTSRTFSVPLSSNMVYTASSTSPTSAASRPAPACRLIPSFPLTHSRRRNYDHDSGKFIDNPQTNKYSGLNATYEVDAHNGSFGSGSSSYRPSGLNTEANGDKPRLAYGTGLQDFDVGWNDGGSGKWGNYTRTFPAGTYNIYMRGRQSRRPHH